jgi:hypothetical protein
MSNPNPTCVFTTLSDIRDAKRLKRIDENQELLKLKEISRYDIKNALTKTYMPLSDNIHGPYYMMPPELLCSNHYNGRLVVVRFVMILTNCIFEYTCLSKGRVNVTFPEVP